MSKTKNVVDAVAKNEFMPRENSFLNIKKRILKVG